MEKTPKTSRHRINKVKLGSEGKYPSTELSETESQTIDGAELEYEDSPGSEFFPCSQTGNEEMLVGWDWNSPQVKAVKQKRKILSQSPRPSWKRHLSNNNLQNLEKLKEELQALKEQIAAPENCHLVSPSEEDFFKNEYSNLNNESALDSLIKVESNKNSEKDFEDIFNDSIDQELLLCTQVVENVFDSATTSKSSDYVEKSNSNSHSIGIVIDRPINSKETLERSQNIDIEMQTLSHFSNNLTSDLDSGGKLKSVVLARANTDPFSRISNSNFLQTESGKVEFFRTQSFELSKSSISDANLPKSKLDEIEKNRLEALAKLKAKRKKEDNDKTNSPIHCSPDEIEQKRLQALAKLDAKKKLEIEKKRQEALKRLEINRVKRANAVRTTINKRL